MKLNPNFDNELYYTIWIATTQQYKLVKYLEEHPEKNK